MTCPRCHSEFETTVDLCPECGIHLLRSVSGVITTSTVMISAGEECGFYHSVQDVPEPLRKQLLDSTAGGNAGTIVIADRAGKDQLTQAIARRESRRDADSHPGPTAPTPGIPEALPPPRIAWLAWAGFGLVLVLAGIAAGFFYLHW